MARRILITVTRAKRQIAAAREWWKDNRDKAPSAFDEDLERTLDLIVEHPAVGAAVRNTRSRRTRRLYIERIGYYLYYDVTDEAILVVGLRHSARGGLPRL